MHPQLLQDPTYRQHTQSARQASRQHSLSIQVTPGSMGGGHPHPQAYTQHLPGGAQIINVPINQVVPQSPTTPFDINYAKGMLPRQLLVSSPFIQSPATMQNNIHSAPISPTGDRFFKQNQQPQYQQPMYSTYNDSGSSFFNYAPVAPIRSTPSRKTSFSKNLKSKLSQASNTTNRSINSLSNELLRQVSKSKSNNNEPQSNTATILDDEAGIFSSTLNTTDSTDAEDNINSPSLNDETPTTEESKNANKSKPSTPGINTRSLKLLNLRPDIQLRELLDIIEFGPIENCVFELDKGDGTSLLTKTIILSFVEISTAESCYNQLLTIQEELSHLLDSSELSIIPTNSQPLLSVVQEAIQNDGATRSVCISNIQPGIPPKVIQNELEDIGTVEMIKYIPAKSAVFVYFTAISAAIKCVEQLPLSDSILSSCKVFYGKDRSTVQSASSFAGNNSTIDLYESESSQPSYLGFYSTPSTSVSSPQIANATVYKSSSGARQTSDPSIPIPSFSSSQNLQYQQITPATPHGTAQYPSYSTEPHYLDPYNGLVYSDQTIANNTPTLATMATFPINDSVIHSNIGNRTVYLGNLHPETTAEEVCNTIRGGLLESIKLIPDRHICFLTFIDHIAAAQFFASSTNEKVVIHTRKAKIGWGKHPGPLSEKIAIAVENGGSRNLYIGIVENDGENEEQDEDEEDGADEEKDDHNETESKKDDSEQSALKVPDIDILRRDFSVFGEVEQINFFKDGECAFVNFLNINSSIDAVNEFNGEKADGVHLSFQNRYKKFKISFGKDRCGNPPKSKKSKKNKNKKRREKVKLKRQQEQQQEQQQQQQQTPVPQTGDDSELLNQSIESVDDAIKSASVFKSIGITSKSLDDKRKKIIDAVNEVAESNVNGEATEEDVATENEEAEFDEDDDDDIVFISSSTKHELNQVRIGNSSSSSLRDLSSDDLLPKNPPRFSRRKSHSNHKGGSSTGLYKSFSRSSSAVSVNHYSHSDQYQQPFQYQPSAGYPRIFRTNSRKSFYQEQQQQQMSTMPQTPQQQQQQYLYYQASPMLQPLLVPSSPQLHPHIVSSRNGSIYSSPHASIQHQQSIQRQLQQQQQQQHDQQQPQQQSMYYSNHYQQPNTHEYYPPMQMQPQHMTPIHAQTGHYPGGFYQYEEDEDEDEDEDEEADGQEEASDDDDDDDKESDGENVVNENNVSYFNGKGNYYAIPVSDNENGEKKGISSVA